MLDLLIKVGGLLAYATLAYAIISNFNRRPKLKFDFEWSSGIRKYKKNNLVFGEKKFQGVIKSQSLNPNTLVKIYLVVWGNRQKTKYLRFGYGGVIVQDMNENKRVKLPLNFAPREGKRLLITFEFPITGTSDEKIIKETDAITGQVIRNILDYGIYKLKSLTIRPFDKSYDLAFEDAEENLFDTKGNIINSKELDLRWTHGNYKGIRYLREYVVIYTAKIKFFVRRLLRVLGI